MNIVADEGVGGAIVRRLISDGHSVTWIAEESPGLPDDLVIAAAHDANALLVTYDKDFGELVVRRGAAHHRVMLFRLRGLDSADRAVLVSRAIRDHASELSDAFTVVTPTSIRIRSLE